MDRLLELVRSHPALAGAAVVVAIGLGAGSWLVIGGAPSPSPSPSPTASVSATPSTSPTPSASPSPSPTPSPSPVAIRCPWNGLPLADGEELSPVALAVQIENNPAARPVSNLGLADMVVEATVEGDVTRFTAIFQCTPTQALTGPVRSARYYSQDLWQDLHVLPFFFGAGWEALHRFDAAGVPYVNGIFGEWPGAWFTRYGPHAAPHNLYADVEAARASLGSYPKLDALADRVGEPRPQFTFDPDLSIPDGGRSIGSVELSTNSYWHFGWTWDATSETWLRTDGGAPNVDTVTGEQLAARAVIVETVVETVDNTSHDPGGSPRRVHQLVGSGTGILYLDGRAYDVNWSRPTASDGTTWTYASSGDVVVLPPGVVWWEIVPTYTTIEER